MGFLKRFLKRRALDSYKRRLPRLLAKDYGASRTYTPAQVGKTIERNGLSTDYADYAIAMFSDRDTFEDFYSRNGRPSDYESMRDELAAQYFGGNVDFTYTDIVSASGWDGSLHDSSGGGEAGSHGGADGGHGH